MDLERALQRGMAFFLLCCILSFGFLKEKLRGVRNLVLIVTGSCTLVSVYYTALIMLHYWLHRRRSVHMLWINSILIMPPVCGIRSFFVLLGPIRSFPIIDLELLEDFVPSTDLEYLNDFVEAAAMVSLMDLMCTYLKVSHDNIPDELKGREIYHYFPMTLFQPNTVFFDHRHLKLLQKWIGQYLYVQLACTFLIPILEMLNLYPNWWLSWIYFGVRSISMSLALYSIAIFQSAFAKEMARHRSLAKFAVIKGIVFICFWQRILLEILVYVGAIKAHYDWLDRELSIQEYIQNILTCGEMMIFSAFQFYAFPALPRRRVVHMNRLEDLV